MTSEDDFQAALDKDPSDWQTRLVLADWLQDRGDVRAEGYRALGINRRFPDGLKVGGNKTIWWWSHWREDDRLQESNNWRLPKEWCELMEVRDASPPYYPIASTKHKNSRRELEDAAALGFSKLPAARRAELLAAPPPRARKPKKKPTKTTKTAKKKPTKKATSEAETKKASEEKEVKKRAKKRGKPRE